MSEETTATEQPAEETVTEVPAGEGAPASPESTAGDSQVAAGEIPGGVEVDPATIPEQPPVPEEAPAPDYSVDYQLMKSEVLILAKKIYGEAVTLEEEAKSFALKVADTEVHRFRF